MDNSLAAQLAQKFADIRKEFQDTLAENCPVPLFVCDCDGKWIYSNEPLQMLLAAAPEDLLDVGWQRYVAVESAISPGKMVMVWLNFLARKDTTEKLALVYKSADGRYGTIYIRTVLTQTGNHIGFVLPICPDPGVCPMHGFLWHNF